MIKQCDVHAVVPIAGLGTRMGALFLRRNSELASKALLSINGVPTLLWAAKEIYEAGVTNVTFVMRRDHMCTHWLLTNPLEVNDDLHLLGKQDVSSRFAPFLAALSNLNVKIAYQSEALGLGHAVWCAMETVQKGNTVAIVLPDDMFLTTGQLPLSLLIDTYNSFGTNGLTQCHKSPMVILLRKFAKNLVSRFGVVVPGLSVGDGSNTIEIKGVEEKPREPKSELAIMGRYLMPWNVFEVLHESVRSSVTGHGGEIQLTDAIARLHEEHGHPFYGSITDAFYLDCGTSIGFSASHLIMEAYTSGRLTTPRLIEVVKELGYSYV